VSSDYFSVTGLKPLVGRTFSHAEVALQSHPVVLISHDLWQRRFNGDPGIIGQTVAFSRFQSLTVIGVMPRGVRFLPAPMSEQSPNYDVNARIDFWVPASAAAVDPGQPIWNAVARLRRGVSLEQAQAELTGITARQGNANPQLQGITARVVRLETESNRRPRALLIPLFGAALLVWLIASGNVAALFLARGIQRQREFSLRSALGAGRYRLVRQVLADSLVPALIGGALGMLLAIGTVRVFVAVGASAVPRLDAVNVDATVLAFSAAISVLSAVFAGIVPALRAARVDPASGLKTGGPNSTARKADWRALRFITSAQLALTLALLVGAGLLLRTVYNLSAVQPGYETRNILTMLVTAVEGDEVRFHREALARIQLLPGVKAAAFGWGVPLTGGRSAGRVSFDGHTGPDLSITARAVTADYFDALGMRVLDGRDFRSSDDADAAPVVIINQAMAERHFSGVNPLGRKLRVKGWAGEEREIIGMVPDVRADDLSRPAEPELYLPFEQATAFSKHLLVRTDTDPLQLAARIQRALRSLSPTVAVEAIKTLEQARSDSLSTRIFAMRLITAFALAACALALVATYGALSLSVARQHRELAIRHAVGAQRGDIFRKVLLDGLELIGGSMAIGMVIALILSRLLVTLLFEVEARDPINLLVASVLFGLMAILACFMPARRAARIAPMDALRTE
jgi:putative ABC transport system permease protein